MQPYHMDMTWARRERIRPSTTHGSQPESGAVNVGVKAPVYGGVWSGEQHPEYAHRKITEEIIGRSPRRSGAYTRLGAEGVHGGMGAGVGDGVRGDAEAWQHRGGSGLGQARRTCVVGSVG